MSEIQTPGWTNIDVGTDYAITVNKPISECEFLVANICCRGKPSMDPEWQEIQPRFWYRVWRRLTPWMKHQWAFERKSSQVTITPAGDTFANSGPTVKFYE